MNRYPIVAPLDESRPQSGTVSRDIRAEVAEARWMKLATGKWRKR